MQPRIENAHWAQNVTNINVIVKIQNYWAYFKLLCGLKMLFSKQGGGRPQKKLE